MYKQFINRAHPSLIVMALDDSESMQDYLRQTTDPRYLWVERYTQQIFEELLARSTEFMPDNSVDVRPRYFLQTIIYGSELELWPDNSARQSVGLAAEEEVDIASVIKLYTAGDHGRGNSFGLGGHKKGTDTRKAFDKAHDLLSNAVAGDRFKDSFPPMLFHLTDGESQSDAEPTAERIKLLTTNDGNVLILNAFIGTQTSLPYNGPEDFTGYLSEDEAGPLDHSKKLFRMSSEVPETIRQNLINDGIFPQIRQGSRLYFDVRTKAMLRHVIQTVNSVVKPR